MAGKAQTKTLFRVPESNQVVEHTVATKRTELDAVEHYRDFIKRTTGYEPSVSDVFNQAMAFFIARDTVYRKHQAGESNLKRAGKSAVKPSASSSNAKLFANAD